MLMSAERTFYVDGLENTNAVQNRSVMCLTAGLAICSVAVKSHSSVQNGQQNYHFVMPFSICFRFVQLLLPEYCILLL